MGRLRLALALALAGVSLAHAAEPGKVPAVKVGILRLTSSAPVFVGVEKGFPYQDRDGRLDVQDIGRQLGWYHKAEMIMRGLSSRDLADASFLDEAPRALPR